MRKGRNCDLKMRLDLQPELKVHDGGLTRGKRMPMSITTDNTPSTGQAHDCGCGCGGACGCGTATAQGEVAGEQTSQEPTAVKDSCDCSCGTATAQGEVAGEQTSQEPTAVKDSCGCS